ncbi:MAG: SAM-dependent methyltransferase [Aquificaceae bacterium]|nr:SAM-dependent methyltransferase [Aquificaceae bacterium]
MAKAVEEYYRRSDFRRDFFTAPELDRSFGYALAEYIAGLLREFKEPVLLELGGGSGALAYDVLTYYKETEKEIYRNLRYYIYDFSPTLIKVQRERLKEFGNKVFWVESLVNLEGVVFSNEFFDCLPVHVIRDGKELFLQNDSELWLELEDHRLVEVLKRMGYENLSQTVEVCLECVDFLKKVAAHLRRGYHIVIDYGYTTEELKKFPGGTVAGYKAHKFYPTASEGMDITAHVNFSLLEEYGKDYGLESISLKSLRDFLMESSVFIKELERLSVSEEPEDVERLSRLKTMLVSMGGRFKVIVQRKLQEA